MQSIRAFYSDERYLGKLFRESQDPRHPSDVCQRGNLMTKSGMNTHIHSHSVTYMHTVVRRHIFHWIRFSSYQYTDGSHGSGRSGIRASSSLRSTVLCSKSPATVHAALDTRLQLPGIPSVCRPAKLLLAA